MLLNPVSPFSVSQRSPSGPAARPSPSSGKPLTTVLTCPVRVIRASDPFRRVNHMLRLGPATIASGALEPVGDTP